MESESRRADEQPQDEQTYVWSEDMQVRYSAMVCWNEMVQYSGRFSARRIFGKNDLEAKLGLMGALIKLHIIFSPILEKKRWQRMKKCRQLHRYMGRMRYNTGFTTASNTLQIAADAMNGFLNDLGIIKIERAIRTAEQKALP